MITTHAAMCVQLDFFPLHVILVSTRFRDYFYPRKTFYFDIVFVSAVFGGSSA